MKSDLELWLESDNARTAVQAAHKINGAARTAGIVAGLIDEALVLTREECKAYQDMLALMDRLAGEQKQ